MLDCRRTGKDRQIHAAMAGGVLLGVVVMAALLARPVAPPGVCSCGRPPHFVLGFAELKAHLGEEMGEAIECEQPDPAGAPGDAFQRTTRGIAVYRRAGLAPNAPPLAFISGRQYSVLGPAGLTTVDGPAVHAPGRPSPSGPRPFSLPRPLLASQGLRVGHPCAGPVPTGQASIGSLGPGRGATGSP